MTTGITSIGSLVRRSLKRLTNLLLRRSKHNMMDIPYQQEGATLLLPPKGRTKEELDDYIKAIEDHD